MYDTTEGAPKHQRSKQLLDSVCALFELCALSPMSLPAEEKLRKAFAALPHANDRTAVEWHLKHTLKKEEAYSMIELLTSPPRGSIMRNLIMVACLTLLYGCGSGGGGSVSSTSPLPPIVVIPITYQDFTVSDVAGSGTAPEYRPTLVREGSDGSWRVEFSRDGNVLRFNLPSVPAWSYGWVMSRWSVNASGVVDCIVTNSTSSGAPDIRAKWILTPVAAG